jgi:acyl-CoA synthetase (NDP forming)
MLDDIVGEMAARARAEGREVLLEQEGLEIARALGVRVPRSLALDEVGQLAHVDLRSLPGDHVVLKVVSTKIQHKSDVGGVAVVAKERAAIEAAIGRMQDRIPGGEIQGYSLSERVDFETGLGSELLLGLRFTHDFGPIVSIGPGGVQTELLAGSLRAGAGTAVLSPAFAATLRRDAVWRSRAWGPVVIGGFRGRRPLLAEADLATLLERALELAARHCPDPLLEFEVNPLVLTDGGPVALDALARLAVGAPPAPGPERPLVKIQKLLRPESVAIVGVSKRLNPGRIILDNLIREGFPKKRCYVIKPGSVSLAGCRCVTRVAELPEAVDLLVLSVEAAQVPALVSEVIEHEKAEGLIVIPGGLGERPGTEELEAQVTRALGRSRASRWRGPVLNGGNCLGIRSRPGRYDTMFIPEHKLEPPQGAVSPLAFVSQSGALAVATASKLAALNPRYLISVGNQTDLTVGDYMEHLKNDPELEVFACYVEGFRPLDGLAWLRAVAEIVEHGKTVLLYRAGRTQAGALATASHTAVVAGDYVVTQALAEAVGALVAESLDDLVELSRLFCMLRGKHVAGTALGALSNAGFECVAYADNLGPLRLAELSAATRTRLLQLLVERRIDGIVSVRNPLDVTPMMEDGGFAEAARAILEDPAVDVGIVGCVPLTGSLQTLPQAADHLEDLEAEEAVAQRLIELFRAILKPWVAVVDAGSAYDPLVARLEAGGVPTFRSADRALRLLGRYCTASLGPRAPRA